MRFSGTIPFERSLRLDEAGDSGAILANVMNGEPLPTHRAKLVRGRIGQVAH